MSRPQTRVGVVLGIVALLSLQSTPTTMAYAATTPTWSAQAPMPTPRGLAGVTVLNGKIYVLGGTSDYFNNLATVEAYDPPTNTWQTLASLSGPRQRGSAAAANGKIYLIGGRTPESDTVSTVEEYDPALNTWQTKANAPLSALGSSAVTAPNGKIYLFGGYPGCCFNYLNAVHEYDPVTDTWTAKAGMPTAREGSAAALAANGKIYVLGGNGVGDIWRVMEEYDPATNTWAVRSPALINQSYGQLVAGPDGMLYDFGTFSDNGTVMQYDPATDTWATPSLMPTPRQLLMAAAPGNGKIYVIGGTDPSTPWPFSWLGTNEALSFAPPQFPFTGFFQPMDNPPTVNKMKAGSAIPVKFSLGGDQGLSIFDPDYPASQQYNCSTGDPVDVVEETVSAGSSGLRYDSSTGIYAYTWKTDQAWKGMCRLLLLNFTDGTSHTAKFQFS